MRGWHQAQVRLGCRVSVPPWPRAASPDQVGLAQQFQCLLRHWNSLGKKRGFAFCCSFKKKGGKSQTHSPSRQRGPLEMEQMFSAEACSGPQSPRLYQLKGRWERRREG